MHIPDRDRCNWLRERIETPEPVPFTRKEKLHTLDRLAWSDMFETFLANKYTVRENIRSRPARGAIGPQLGPAPPAPRIGPVSRKPPNPQKTHKKTNRPPSASASRAARP